MINEYDFGALGLIDGDFPTIRSSSIQIYLACDRNREVDVHIFRKRRLGNLLRKGTLGYQ